MNSAAACHGWQRVARRRRLLLAGLLLGPTALALYVMASALPNPASMPLEALIVAAFGALFGWISLGLWTALAGFITLVCSRSGFAITRTAEEARRPLDATVRTAIIVPICNEPVDRVFAGLRATSSSLERTGTAGHFDVFVLSDSYDTSTWLAEEEAWADWCGDAEGARTINYRRRRVRIKCKSGNVADFCRRWGMQYRYMIVLDADSVMSGDAIVRLVEIMEANRHVGIVQTVPVATGGRSLFARIQQFSRSVYGPLWMAGLHYWQLGHGAYWGHNAVIRIEPFMRHCSLASLPGQPPLGGEILSHDFVEAGHMGRAGWQIWLAYDLRGSYEETPSSLLEELRRDRRWCQGNLQHLRLLFTEGLYPAHRALLLNGVMSYGSAVLWLLFLTLGIAQTMLGAFSDPVYFPAGPSLFPQWPVWRPDWAVWLVAATGVVLFLPKLLGLALVAVRGQARDFGGASRLCASAFAEALVTSLLAPVRMMFHAKFVLVTLLGRTIRWVSQARGDDETHWRTALPHHGKDTLLGAAVAAGIFFLSPAQFWWLTPVAAALLLSIPLSVLLSRVTLGHKARRFGLFLTPEETSPPLELRELGRDLEARLRRRALLPVAERDGFVRAVVDPRLNALHCATLRPRSAGSQRARAHRRALARRALLDGPASLTGEQRRELLLDREQMLALHSAVWADSDLERLLAWGRPAYAHVATGPAGSSGMANAVATT